MLAGDLDDYETVGFHAQQAAEKFLKAVLVKHQVEFPKSHDLVRLRTLVSRVDQALADVVAAADSLTPHGVEFRYPGEVAPLSHEQGAEAVRLAERVRDAVLGHLRDYLAAGRPVLS